MDFNIDAILFASLTVIFLTEILAIISLFTFEKTDPVAFSNSSGSFVSIIALTKTIG
jgi:hypothetical protein